MRTIVQVEYRPGLLSVREEILQFLGNAVVSVFGPQAARELDVSDKDVGVVLIGHGAPWSERSELMEDFKRILHDIPVIASLRQADKPFENADYNCPAARQIATFANLSILEIWHTIRTQSRVKVFQVPVGQQIGS